MGLELFAKLGNLSTANHTSVVSINLFVAILCVCIVIGHLLEESRWMNESITALIIVSSLICSVSDEKSLYIDCD